jgi:thiosulfate reductase cytochrome b subunit
MFGSYDGARIVHFVVMIYFILFLVPHVILVLVEGWDTMRSMVVGWSSRIGGSE